MPNTQAKVTSADTEATENIFICIAYRPPGMRFVNELQKHMNSENGKIL
jgi:hypothetical protein